MRYRDVSVLKREWPGHMETGGWEETKRVMANIGKDVELHMRLEAQRSGDPDKIKSVEDYIQRRRLGYKLTTGSALRPPVMGRWQYIFTDKYGHMVSLLEELEYVMFFNQRWAAMFYPRLNSSDSSGSEEHRYRYKRDALHDIYSYFFEKDKRIRAGKMSPPREHTISMEGVVEP